MLWSIFNGSRCIRIWLAMALSKLGAFNERIHGLEFTLSCNILPFVKATYLILFNIGMLRLLFLHIVIFMTWTVFPWYAFLST